MKHIILISAFLISQVSLFSQCKYFIDKKDDFTGQSVVITWVKMNQYLTLKPSLNNQKLFLGLIHINDVLLTRGLRIGLDDSLSIKFTDGSVMSLYPEKEIIESVVMNIPVFDLNYILPDAALDRLSTIPVAKIRILAEGNNLDHDIKPAAANKLMTAAACLKQKL